MSEDVKMEQTKRLVGALEEIALQMKIANRLRALMVVEGADSHAWETLAFAESDEYWNAGRKQWDADRKEGEQQ